MMLSAVLLSAAFGLEAARAQTGKEPTHVGQARSAVSKVGVGEKARVEVRLRDNTKLKGYVSEAGADSFTVRDSKTGAARSVAYADVTEVKRRGGGLSTTTKALIWGGIAAGAVITLYVVRGAFCDGMCV
jgi:hypothetical protein